MKTDLMRISDDIVVLFNKHHVTNISSNISFGLISTCSRKNKAVRVHAVPLISWIRKETLLFFLIRSVALIWLGFVIFDRHKLTKRSGDASFRTPTMNIILGILNLGSLISVFCCCTQAVKGWFQAVRWLANVRHNVIESEYDIHVKGICTRDLI